MIPVELMVRKICSCACCNGGHTCENVRDILQKARVDGMEEEDIGLERVELYMRFVQSWCETQFPRLSNLYLDRLRSNADEVLNRTREMLYGVAIADMDCDPEVPEIE